MVLRKHCLTVFVLLLTISLEAQYKVDVQVIDLLVSVYDKSGNYIQQLRPEDFLVFENDAPQEIEGLELMREPFSIGILLDTSRSMRSGFQTSSRGIEDFIYSLRPDDEYFVMTFDDRVVLRKPFGFAKDRAHTKWEDYRYGERTRLYDAVMSAIGELDRSRYPRRALFLISDGVNTRGDVDLGTVIAEAQKKKVLVYSLLFESQETDLNALRMLSESTGGSYFLLYDEYPRLAAAYEKIAKDLAHRFTLFYRSHSDYTAKKPEITVKMKNPEWRVRFQKTYYP